MSRKLSVSPLRGDDIIALMVVGLLVAATLSAVIGQFVIAFVLGTSGCGLAGLSADRLQQPVTLNLKER